MTAARIRTSEPAFRPHTSQWQRERARPTPLSASDKAAIRRGWAVQFLTGILTFIAGVTAAILIGVIA